ncbi:recombinase family protein [Nonomuraea sp. NPDC050394]|uniref:recombinase family protein n=1 Tax=Nonomuraea sp. NPDC050394 TaxID=3364363 RepID=UPI0037A3E39F
MADSAHKLTTGFSDKRIGLQPFPRRAWCRSSTPASPPRPSPWCGSATSSPRPVFSRTEGVAEGFRPADGVLLFEDPATTSKIPALDRPAFGKIAAKAHPGDTLTVSELFRLCRDLLDIHAVRNWCQARGVALRVLSGPLSNSHDLAAGDATTAVIINVITAVGQFQRDIQNELTVEGIAATAAGHPRWTVTGARTYGRPSARASRSLPWHGLRGEPGGRANRPGRPASVIGVIDDGKGQATRSRSRQRPMPISIVPYRLALDQNNGESPRLSASVIFFCQPGSLSTD